MNMYPEVHSRTNICLDYSIAPAWSRALARCPSEQPRQVTPLDFVQIPAVRQTGHPCQQCLSRSIQTEMFDRAFGEGETDMKKTIATQTPVGRIGTPEEIASAVLWLSSHGAAFVTGQDITVDGGYTAQ